MYSTRFDDELRYVVTCITNRDTVRVVETIVDTGAKYTCYRASLIDDELHEEDLGTNQSVEIGGFVSGDEPINKVRILLALGKGTGIPVPFVTFVTLYLDLR